MARELNQGDTVYVPCSLLDDADLAERGEALYRTTVDSIEGRSVSVTLPNGQTSKAIGSALIHQDVGVLVVNFGDFTSEYILLDPLAKSVGQFCRLLVHGDCFLQVRIRSLAELKVFWEINHAAYTHVIWVGHGSSNGLNFAVDGPVTAEDLVEVLSEAKPGKKLFLSLCCNQGYQSFGSKFSKASFCKGFIAPFHKAQGAAASQFCQTFLAHHFLGGCTVKTAFKKSRGSVRGGADFRLWEMGKLVSGPK